MSKEEILEKLMSLGSITKYSKVSKPHFGLYAKEISQENVNFLIGNCKILSIVPNIRSNGINISFTLKDYET